MLFLNKALASIFSNVLSQSLVFALLSVNKLAQLAHTYHSLSLPLELLLVEGSRRAHVHAHQLKGLGFLSEGASHSSVRLLDQSAEGALLEHLALAGAPHRRD